MYKIHQEYAHLFNTPNIRKHTCMKHFPPAVINFKYPCK